MNDLRRLHERYQVEIKQEVLSTLRSGWWLNGNKGALELALAAVVALTKPQGREVLLVANAGGYASGACWRNGLVPHFVDVEPHSHLMDIHAAVEAASSLTAAMVVTHLYGNVAVIPVSLDQTADNRNRGSCE